LQTAFVLPVSALLLAACGSAKKTASASKATNPCEDLTDVPAVDVQKRKSLGYASLSPMPDKQCNNCKLFVPPQEGKECGGCLLFAGPVAPEGYCTYWAPPE